MTTKLISKAEAARQLNVTPNTIGDMVASLRIATKPIKKMGGGDGIEPRDFLLIRRRLTPPRRWPNQVVAIESPSCRMGDSPE